MTANPLSASTTSIRGVRAVVDSITNGLSGYAIKDNDIPRELSNAADKKTESPSRDGDGLRQK